MHGCNVVEENKFLNLFSIVFVYIFSYSSSVSLTITIWQWNFCVNRQEKKTTKYCVSFLFLCVCLLPLPQFVARMTMLYASTWCDDNHHLDYHKNNDNDIDAGKVSGPTESFRLQQTSPTIGIMTTGMVCPGVMMMMLLFIQRFV